MLYVGEESIGETLMKFKIVESLDESLEPLLGGSAYITDSPYEIRDLLMNKPKAYRLLYDDNIKKYMICDADEHIHHDMLIDAFDSGDYIRAERNMKIDERVREYMAQANRYPRDIYSYVDLGQDGYYYNEDEDYVGIGQYLLYMIFVPDGMDEEDVSNSPSSDGYDDSIEYSFGTLWTRDAEDFSDKCDLLKILSRYKV